jgi:hypothetical protein
VSLAPPVFIVSLPRGGTTALLNALHRLPEVATHEYRDMPFVTAPLLWSRLGGNRSKRVEKRERAHGDGMEIDLDSPEAFDEVLWRAHWPQKYTAGRIQTFDEGDLEDEATDDFAKHHAKVALVRGRSADACRYVSKNNANIGRLRVLDRMFPGCSIVVALRRPAAHAASLHRQHERFLRLHAEDPFIRDYMRDIGHLEFGELHQPIDFADLADLVGAREPSEPDYWLAYWIAAFEEVARHQGGVIVVQQDDLRARPQATMERVCSSLRIDNAGTDFTSEFRPGADPTPENLFSPDLLARADALYERIAAKAMAAAAEGGD